MRSKWCIHPPNPKRRSKGPYPEGNSIMSDKTVTQNTIPHGFLCQLHDCSMDSEYTTLLLCVVAICSTTYFTLLLQDCKPALNSNSCKELYPNSATLDDPELRLESAKSGFGNGNKGDFKNSYNHRIVKSRAGTRIFTLCIYYTAN
jgi:hypothetical protein